MENIKVQALYSFSGEPGSAELSITTGEILTVTRQDVGDGWWEGTNQNGQTGLFPAAYVEVCGDQPVDYWEEEWDDEYDTNIPPPPPVTYPIENDSQPKSQAEPVARTTDESSQQVLGRKHFNRYSSFGENYILNETTKVAPDSEKMIIIETENGVMWSPITQPYSCIVASPKKESKLKGLKSFIAYQITPSFNNIQVSRRYKHFDWLHERLEEKYSLIPIPPLPDKQIAGRYEEQFIEHRKNQLQAFVDTVCRHPILSRSPVWEHFITCTDDKMWKMGKRRAEKDEFVGANNFYSIEAPNKSINPYILEQEATSYAKFVQNMDSAVKLLMDTAADQTKKHSGLYKREYQKIGQAFYSLGHAMSCEFPKGRGHENLTTSIKTIGDTYSDIGKMFEDQPKLDWEPLGDMLHIYKGLLASIPDILSLHKRLLFKKKEYERRAFEQKMTPAYIDGVSRRTDALSYAILAEMNHFYSDRAVEVSKALKNHLQQQLEFYRKVTDKLEHAVNSFDG